MKNWAREGSCLMVGKDKYHDEQDHVWDMSTIEVVGEDKYHGEQDLAWDMSTIEVVGKDTYHGE